jgi:acid phosphatase
MTIGTRLRNLYINKLGLLPERLDASNEDSVYFRSTNMGRTIESLESVVRGLLPQTQEPSSDFHPTLLVR